MQFKHSHLLQKKNIFDIQSMQSWYKFLNNLWPHYFQSMLQYNSILYEWYQCQILQMNANIFNCMPGIWNVLWHHSPELVDQFPYHVIENMQT